MGTIGYVRKYKGEIMKYVFKKGLFIPNMPKEGIDTYEVIKTHFPHIYEEMEKDYLMFNLLRQSYVNWIQPINVDTSDKEVGFMLGIWNPDKGILLVDVIYLIEKYRGKGLFVDCLEDVMTNEDYHPKYVFLGQCNLGVVTALSKRGYSSEIGEGVVRLNKIHFCSFKMNDGMIELNYITPYYDTVDCRSIAVSVKANHIVGSQVCDIDYYKNNLNFLQIMSWNDRSERVKKLLINDAKSNCVEEEIIL